MPTSPPNPKLSKFPAITEAAIQWQEQTPYSTEFDDIYYSPKHGYDEAKYVFVEQNQLCQRWHKANQNASFTIAETGFGTGLNFFTSWEHWKKSAPRNSHLNYVSVEKYPLAKESIRKALSHWPHLGPLVEPFLAQYPTLTAGFHRRIFTQDRLTLTLIFMDAEQALASLDTRVDAWFLDGFAPKKNPQLWSDNVFQQIKRLSDKGTSLATFTAASAIRKKLQAIGFEVYKTPGFGKKREMIKAQFRAPTANLADHNFTLAASHSDTRSGQNKPWFTHKNPTTYSQKKAIVVGAGIAGCTVAESLAKRGWQINILEKNAHSALEASGNPWGALYCRFNTHRSTLNDFFQHSYFYAANYFKTLAATASGQRFWQPDGLLQVAYNEQEENRLRDTEASNYWPTQLIQYKTIAQASEIAGLPINRPALWIADSGRVQPKAFCDYLINQYPSISLKTQQLLQQLRYCPHSDGAHWQLLDKEGKVLDEAEIVVLTNGAQIKTISQGHFLPLSTIRGQLSYLPATENSANLRTVLSYEGYITPSYNGHHVLGATFHPKETTPLLRAQDHQQNIIRLAEISPEVAAELMGTKKIHSIPGRVAFRCQTPDYLPVVGPIPDFNRFVENYSGLRVGNLKAHYPPGDYLNGLFCCVAHGSKGLISAPLCAEVIAAHIENQPQAIAQSLVQAIHPARFIIRGLKRKQF